MPLFGQRIEPAGWKIAETSGILDHPVPYDAKTKQYLHQGWGGTYIFPRNFCIRKASAMTSNLTYCPVNPEN